MANEQAALREARRARLAAKQSPTQGSNQQPQRTSLTPEIPQQVTAQVLDPAKISKTARISMHLFNVESTDPHWLVCADGQPVAQIRLSDQDDQDTVKRVFTTDAYANGIVEAAQKIDLTEILTGIKARPFVAVVEGATAYEAMKQRVEAAASEDLRRTKANLRSNMLNTLSLVVHAQSKNFVSANTLKDALFTRLKQAGIESDRAVAVIEAAWQDKSQDYFEECFKQAGKWMDLTPEAYAELEEQIRGMQHRTPVVEREASTTIAHANGPTQAANVPLQTYQVHGQSAEEPSAKDKVRSTFNFRQRQLDHGMATR